MPTGSASQYPCGWPETRRRKGGEILSTKASTAALDRFGQRLLLPGDAFRATRLAVRNRTQGIDAETGFKNPGKRLGRGGQSFICSRDIIIIVSTCLPSKNCPHRVRAATFYCVCYWPFFLSPSPASLSLTRLKMPPGRWREESRQFRSESAVFFYPGKIIPRWETSALKC